MRKMICVLALLCLMALPAAAHEVPDLTRQGSISITVRYDGEAVPGGEITLQRVGDICENDGNYGFVLTQEFAPSNISLESLQSADTAKKLADFAAQRKITGLTKTIGTDGTVTFASLKPGLYLLVQGKAAPGFEKAAPFLVTMPMRIGEQYHYQVDAGPKVSPIPERDPVKPNPDLPKTGQSRWPFWMFTLSAAGLVLLMSQKKRI